MNTFGKLTIIDETRINNKVLCKCECGVITYKNIYNIKSGDTKSCGCLRKEKMKVEAHKRFQGKSPKHFVDYSGRTIGLITVLKRIKNDHKDTWYLARCECGTEFEVPFSSLRRAKYEKCRCGFENHPLKETLQRMIDRCENPRNKSFKWYGGKGIKVFFIWMKFPVKFIEWAIQNGWKEGLSIDRKDSSKGYLPENCHWISLNENCRKASVERWGQKDSE